MILSATGYMQERESLLMDLIAFRNVSLLIQMCLFTLFYSPEYFHSLPTWLCILCAIFTQVLKTHVNLQFCYYFTAREIMHICMVLIPTHCSFKLSFKLLRYRLIPSLHSRASNQTFLFTGLLKLASS